MNQFPSSTVYPVDVMRRAKVIAVVGASKSPEKEAHTVPEFLQARGFRIIPVNPTAAEVLGERSFPDLLSIPQPLASEIDTVEVFRPSEELPAVARSVVELSKRNGRKYVFWAQAGLENDEAKRILDDAGIPYVMNACMRVVYPMAFRR
jgi:uncharacterized protein